MTKDAPVVKVIEPVGAYRFRDRAEAGRLLAEHLRDLAPRSPVVVGLPRGGVPVAFEIARELHAPLDVIVVRKLGVPLQPELGMGAVGEDGTRVVNPDVLAGAGVTARELATVERRERAEVERRAARFRGGRAMVPLAGRLVVIVDDGVATGGTARAALRVARAHGAARVVLAVPVAAPDVLDALAADAEQVIALEAPTDLWAIGAWYRDFAQVPDERVIELLDQARTAPGGPAPGPAPGPNDERGAGADVRGAREP